MKDYRAPLDDQATEEFTREHTPKYITEADPRKNVSPVSEEQQHRATRSIVSPPEQVITEDDVSPLPVVIMANQSVEPADVRRAWSGRRVFVGTHGTRIIGERFNRTRLILRNALAKVYIDSDVNVSATLSPMVDVGSFPIELFTEGEVWALATDAETSIDVFEEYIIEE